MSTPRDQRTIKDLATLSTTGLERPRPLPPAPSFIDELPRVYPLTIPGSKSELPLKAGDQLQFSVAPPEFNTEGIEQHMLDAMQYSMTNIVHQSAWANMTKKDYEKLAAAVRAMRKGVIALNYMTQNDVDAVMEIIIARIGLMLAEDNKNFDSFVFAAACKGTKA